MTIDVKGMLEALGIEGRRQGASLWACCPFAWHEDEKPSWSIRLDSNGANWCFGCSSGGDALDLVANKLDITRGGAWAWLLERGLVEEQSTVGGVDLQIVGGERGQFVLPPFDAHAMLTLWPAPPRRYLLSRRIGCNAVARWKMKLIVHGRLGGRILVPIFDEAGKPASYSARTFVGDDLRYMTPHRDEHPNLDAVFGSHFWPRVHADRISVVVCEGVLDAISCDLAGAKCVAAFNGSAPTASQLAAIATFKRAIVVSDCDVAGDKMHDAVRAIGRWCEVVRPTLPPGEDPNSMWVTSWSSRMKLRFAIGARERLSCGRQRGITLELARDAEAGKAQIVDAIESTRGNMTAAAHLLGIDHATIYRLVHRYDLTDVAPRARAALLAQKLGSSCITPRHCCNANIA